VGNADLPKRVVDAYYAHLPAAVGFLNGYGPANTYDCRDGRPLISYNYYVDLRKPVEEVVEDLQELARINPRRPYFLPVHVRENNNVQRMKEIVSRLGPEFRIVPPREFMMLAGQRPTMTTRYLDEHPDFSGHWKLDPAHSKNIFPASFLLDIEHRGNVLTMTTTAVEPRYVHHREQRTSRTLVIGGHAVASMEDMTRRMGYSAGWSDSVMCSAAWKADGRTMVLTTELRLQTSQGEFPSTSVNEFSLSPDGMTLTVQEWRTTRESAVPVTMFVYRRVL
jgi:hypothetical protein